MYNYNNMNYIPNNFNYNANIYQSNNNQTNSPNNKELINKLNKQAGNNMNFNKPNYVQNINQNDLYEVYAGFIRGNMFKDLYNSYKETKPYEVKPINKQAEMLTYIYAYSFATLDLNLYLDTHPYDVNILNIYKTLTNELNKIQTNYEQEYGPIYVNNAEKKPWTWNNSPWPWEND